VSGAVKQQDGPQVDKGVSPYVDAWRRLKKNKMAMFGLWVVIAMSLLSAGASVISPFDANLQFNWIGAQPMGYSHPWVGNKNELALGKQPQLLGHFKGASNVSFVVEEVPVQEYRVVIQRGVIQRIVRWGAAEFLPELSPGAAPGPLVRKRRDGTLTEPLAEDIVLRAGEPLPDRMALEPRRANRVVWLAALLPSEGERSIYASLDAQGAVAELSIDGKATEIAAFDGRHVKLALRDGEEQVASHPLGTDTSGRDLFSRVLYGGQISLMVGLVATLVSLLIGVVYGAISGFYGGKLDAFLMGVVDILYGIPYMFLVILLLVFFQRSLLMLFVALGAVQWLTMARIVRGQILSLKQKEFVEAARMSGTSDWGILFGHLIPNTLGVVIVYTTLTVPAVILQESFLAFIGLTVQYEGQSLDSWGALVKTGVDALGESGERSWLLLWPSFAMAVTLFSLNFLGDGLRDALDPQQRGRS